MIDALANIPYVLLVLLGFSFVVFIHELGHFLAAKWAKIRVLAFAVGFGPAMCSYRKGLGFRRGSTIAEYEKKLEQRRFEVAKEASKEKLRDGELDVNRLPGVSYTEYRLNWLPLGGYVKMLGQEDANPGATSAAIDSYTSVPVWKRMVVVSAGVIMNVILAAVLFIGVYSVGLPSMAPAIAVEEGSPAYEAGLRTGDLVVSANGEGVEVFIDLMQSVALAKRDTPVPITVLRDGEELTFDVVPAYDRANQIRRIDAILMPSATIRTPGDVLNQERLRAVLDSMGLAGVEAGMTLTRVGGTAIQPVPVGPYGEVTLPTALLQAAAESGGRPVPVLFTDESGTTVEAEFTPRSELGFYATPVGEDLFPAEHLLGLTPVLGVREVTPVAAEQGLRAGDAFVRLGEARAPSYGTGIRAIRSASGGSIEATVLRGGELVDLTLRVTAGGTVGFTPASATWAPLLADRPEIVRPEGNAESETPMLDPLASDRITPAAAPGMVVVGVGERGVTSFEALREALQRATDAALAAGTGASVTLDVRAPDAGTMSDGPVQRVEWELSPQDVAQLHALGWTGEDIYAVLAPAEILQQGTSLGDSLRLGLRETKRMLTRVYLTLGRLADGSVKPQQLKGPVGITHIGSQVAQDGMIRLLFFIGLISANLAVLNFLPIPIVDGGLFLMLVYEGITRKPVPIAVQNALTLIGLIGIIGVFLFVTTNDVMNLF